MRRWAASSISSADRCAALVTTIKEGTTGKCYPSPEYNLLPITWTVQPSDPAAEPELQRLVRGVDTHGAAFEDLPQLGAWYTQDLARGGTDLEKRGHQRAEIREMLQQ